MRDKLKVIRLKKSFKMKPISGINVERPEMVESTSLGAAFAAAVGIKLTSFNESDDSHKNVTLFNPKMESDDKEKKFQKWKKAVSRCLDWA